MNLYYTSRSTFLALFLLHAVIVLHAQGLSDPLSALSRYNVIWTSQSKNSSGSMPCGGGDIGLNVWVENGDVLCYLSQSGMFDENNQFLKAGRLRLHIEGNPFNQGDFRQVLRLPDGNILISAGKTSLLVWVDVFHPVIHLELKNAQPAKLKIAYESWRYKGHVIEGAEFRANSYKVPQKKPVKTTRDSIAFQSNGIIFYHRNSADTENIFDYTVRMEGMDAVKKQMYDPITGNTFGGIVQAAGMKPAGNDTGTYAGIPYRSWVLESVRATRSQHIMVGLHTAQVKTPAIWNQELLGLLKSGTEDVQASLGKTTAWWKKFWNRSYVFIDGPDSFISRNYQLFRYQLGCNAYGKWPTKFNGGLFCFDPVYVDKKYSYSPDFRLWGGGTMTAQNQRLVYFPMLKAGDFDMMKPQFDFYLRILKNAELRSQVYWKHPGACFTEQIENFGLPNIMEYGLKRPANSDPGVEYNAWLEYLWETVFEFCYLILDTERYSDADISAYMPLIESCLVFYDQHYRQLARKRGVFELDEHGKYIFYPSSAAETFKMAYNSTTVITALKVILTRLSELPANYADSTQRKSWADMLQRIPDIPTREVNGHRMLAPALSWSRVQNTETPQLYPVFPWGLYGVGKPELELARNTYLYDTLAVKFRSAIGWRQYNIFAARLGMTAEAVELARAKFADGAHRFPSFWGPGFDWTPDHNWGGSAMIGLQEMLLQTDGRKIFLLPAWPSQWNGSFKLHAPYNTTVEASIKAGKLEALHVSPASREKDIILLP